MVLPMSMASAAISIAKATTPIMSPAWLPTMPTDNILAVAVAVAVRQSKRKVLDKSTPMHAINHKLKRTNASVRAKVENRFRWSSVNLGMRKYATVGLRKIRRDCIHCCRGPTYGWRVISICRSYRVEFACWRSETALGFPTSKILSSPAFSLLVWKARTKDPHRHALQRRGHRAQKKW